MVPDMFGTVMGLRIIVRPYPRQEVAWHRKQRIAKKWRKRYGPKYVYPQVNTREILVSERDGIIYCYPAMAAQLRRALEAMQ